jgi:hypothetical protein
MNDKNGNQDSIPRRQKPGRFRIRFLVFPLLYLFVPTYFLFQDLDTNIPFIQYSGEVEIIGTRPRNILSDEVNNIEIAFGKARIQLSNLSGDGMTSLSSNGQRFDFSFSQDLEATLGERFGHQELVFKTTPGETIEIIIDLPSTKAPIASLPAYFTIDNGKSVAFGFGSSIQNNKVTLVANNSGEAIVSFFTSNPSIDEYFSQGGSFVSNKSLLDSYLRSAVTYLAGTEYNASSRTFNGSSSRELSDVLPALLSQTYREGLVSSIGIPADPPIFAELNVFTGPITRGEESLAAILNEESATILELLSTADSSVFFHPRIIHHLARTLDIRLAFLELFQTADFENLSDALMGYWLVQRLQEANLGGTYSEEELLRKWILPHLSKDSNGYTLRNNTGFSRRDSLIGASVLLKASQSPLIEEIAYGLIQGQLNSNGRPLPALSGDLADVQPEEVIDIFAQEQFRPRYIHIPALGADAVLYSAVKDLVVRNLNGIVSLEMEFLPRESQHFVLLNPPDFSKIQLFRQDWRNDFRFERYTAGWNISSARDKLFGKITHRTTVETFALFLN